MTRIPPPPPPSDEPTPGWRVAGVELPPAETFEDTPPHGIPVTAGEPTPPQGTPVIASAPAAPVIGPRDDTPPQGLPTIVAPRTQTTAPTGPRDDTPIEGIPIAPAPITESPITEASTVAPSAWTERNTPASPVRPAPRPPTSSQPPPPAWPSTQRPSQPPPPAWPSAQRDQQPTPPPPTRPGRVRPWWGMGDIALAVPFIIALALVGMVIGFVMLVVSGKDDPLGLDTGGVPLAVIALSLIGQQFGQGIWPFIVSKWKGLGMASDWRWRFKPIDLAIGLGTAIGALVAAGLMAYGVSELLGLGDEEATSNAEFLTDNKGSPWVVVLLAAVIIGAPISEELLFRGLILRAVEKRAGVVYAVVISTVLFTLVHYIGGDLKSNLVIFAAIATVGAILGVITVITDRLAPAIIAHIGFNLVGAIGALTQ